MKNFRLYTRPNSPYYEQTVGFLKLWGLTPQLLKDKTGQYFDLTPPTYWRKFRRDRFEVALEQHRAVQPRTNSRSTRRGPESGA